MNLKRIFFSVGVTKLEEMHSYTSVGETKPKTVAHPRHLCVLFTCVLRPFNHFSSVPKQNNLLLAQHYLGEKQSNTHSLVKRKYSFWDPEDVQCWVRGESSSGWRRRQWQAVGITSGRLLS